MPISTTNVTLLSSVVNRLEAVRQAPCKDVQGERCKQVSAGELDEMIWALREVLFNEADRS